MGSQQWRSQTPKEWGETFQNFFYLSPSLCFFIKFFKNLGKNIRETKAIFSSLKKSKISLIPCFSRKNFFAKKHSFLSVKRSKIFDENFVEIFENAITSAAEFLLKNACLYAEKYSEK
jgi:hypothetical protein